MRYKLRHPTRVPKITLVMILLAICILLATYYET